MPIFASFEALLGHLQLSTVSSEDLVNPTSESDAETIIDVPLGLLFEHVDSHLSLGRNENNRVPIFITSSFRREVALNKVEPMQSLV